MPTAGPSGDQPDFASLYGDDDLLAPRLAAHLREAAVFLSGMEDDSSELAEQYRFANLHPRDWFDAFADVTGS